MNKTSLSKFPVELQTIILTHLTSLHKLEEPQHPDPEELEKTSYDPNIPFPEEVRSSSLFPYNVASVCQLWRDIVVNIPECWTRIVFDVAKSPAPFLDAFMWSDNLVDLQVVVFNSLKDSGIPNKERERQRVLAITRAFLPHIPRCESIIFDLSFESSLPPPAAFLCQPMPHLRELRLECSIGDLNPASIRGRRQQFEHFFPKLEILSLTGFWFINTVWHAGETWLRKLRLSSIPTLRISRSKFAKEGLYSLQTLVSYISQMPPCTDLYFHDLSLLDPFIGKSPVLDERDFGGSLHFQSVSGDFLSLFNLLCTSGVGFRDISFENSAGPTVAPL